MSASVNQLVLGVEKSSSEIKDHVYEKTDINCILDKSPLVAI